MVIEPLNCQDNGSPKLVVFFFSQLVVFSSIFLSYKHVENMFGFEIGRSILNDIYTGFFHHHHYHHMYEKRALSYVSFDLLLLRLFLAN